MEYSLQKRTTKLEEFWDIMDVIIPWDKWVDLIKPHYFSGKRGRPTKGIEKMLRMYLLQCWFTLSDEGVEDSIYDSYAFLKFMGIWMSRRPKPQHCCTSGTCAPIPAFLRSARKPALQTAPSALS